MYGLRCMKQYSFLQEATISNLEFKVTNPKELDDSHRHDICQLSEFLNKDHLHYDENLGLSRNRSISFPDSKFNDIYIKEHPGQTFQKFFLCESDSHIIGFIHYTERQTEYKGHSGWLTEVVIHPNFRKMGIGSKLLEFTKNWVKKNRPSIMIFLGVSCGNPGGITLYNKFGFKPVHQTMICKL